MRIECAQHRGNRRFRQFVVIDFFRSLRSWPFTHVESVNKLRYNGVTFNHDCLRRHPYRVNWAEGELGIDLEAENEEPFSSLNGSAFVGGICFDTLGDCENDAGTTQKNKANAKTTLLPIWLRL